MAVVDQEGLAHCRTCEYPDGLVRFLGKQADAVVLLDIPLYGLDRLGGRHFRPIDRALQRVGIGVRPSTGAQGRGKELAHRISLDAGIGTEHILEIYPYAIYKVLDYLRETKRLTSLHEQTRKRLLDADFRAHFPLPYKRSSQRGSRVAGMNALHSVLAHPEVGLAFEEPLPSPGTRGYSLKGLSDIYDAALGAVLGLHLLKGSPWAVVKGDATWGSMALLTDEWLEQQLDDFLSKER